jgi:hypothetical protein
MRKKNVPAINRSQAHRIAVYTSPHGKPRMQVGYKVGGKGDEVFVRFPNDRETYTFHKNQTGPAPAVRLKAVVTRKQIDNVLKGTFLTPKGVEEISHALCSELGL